MKPPPHPTQLYVNYKPALGQKWNEKRKTPYNLRYMQYPARHVTLYIVDSFQTGVSYWNSICNQSWVWHENFLSLCYILPLESDKPSDRVYNSKHFTMGRCEGWYLKLCVLVVDSGWCECNVCNWWMSLIMGGSNCHLRLISQLSRGKKTGVFPAYMEQLLMKILIVTFLHIFFNFDLLASITRRN